MTRIGFGMPLRVKACFFGRCRHQILLPRTSVTRSHQLYSSQVRLQPEPPVENTTLPVLPWISSLTDSNLSSKTAFKDLHRTLTYGELSKAAYSYHLKFEEDFRVDKTIKSANRALHQKRVAIFTPHDSTFLIALLSTWLSGGIAVPLGLGHPDAHLEYFLKNSDTSVILCAENTKERASVIAKACGAEILPISPTRVPAKVDYDVTEGLKLVSPSPNDSALIVYTSGTTGQPKGVLWKHGALAGQAESMISSWRWSQKDTILHILPLYHVHGLVNCLYTPLSCGAAVWMEPSFKPERVWQHILSEESDRVNVFMAVPTVYVRLLDYQKANQSSMPPPDKIKDICQRKMRLMVSGSAPLPESVFREWEQLTGHAILERYGMTEIGMALSNPYEGLRIPGTVGAPLPGVQARIVPHAETEPLKETVPKNGSRTDNASKTTNNQVREGDKATSGNGDKLGELQIMGENLFHCYWNNEKATEEAFTDDGWFKTGDSAEVRNGVYRLLGRTSSEIIKSGGFKLSALDIEHRIHDHPFVAECAVFGVPDPVWGEKVVCLVKLSAAAPKDVKDAELLPVITKWVADKLPAYAAPKEVRIREEIPRNAMGKVNKKELAKHYEPVTEVA